MTEPTHGFTKHGHPVHANTFDHHPDGTAYQRFNKKVAILLTNNVGTMTCFWVFCCFSLLVLPSVLFAMGYVSKHSLIPAFFLTFGFELLMTWLLSTFIQLVLLPAIMVGQNLQSAAADVRASKQFEDTEDIVHALDLKTEGGLRDAVDEIRGYIDAKVAQPVARKAVAKKAPVKKVAKKAPVRKTVKKGTK
jgi:hypothetical protein